MPNPSLSQTKARQQQMKSMLLTTLGVLGALVAFFCFGFFVVARLYPTKATESNSTKQEPVTQSANSPAPAPSQPQESSSLPPSQERRRNLKEGPTLEAEPDKGAGLPSSSTGQDSGTTPDNAENRDDANSDPERKNSERRSRKNRDGEGDAVQEPTPLERKPREKRRRENDTERKNSEETAPSEERKEENKTDEQNTREAQAETPAPKPEETSPRLHRVQVGAYSTREAAETALTDLQSHGIEAKVRRVKRNGRSYYSLQSGAYKSKESAEAKRQKLQDAGQDAYITQD